MLRLDLSQGVMHTAGVFPRVGLIDRVDLSNAVRARLLSGGVENAFVPAGEIASWHGGVAGCL